MYLYTIITECVVGRIYSLYSVTVICMYAYACSSYVLQGKKKWSSYSVMFRNKTITECVTKELKFL